MTICCKASAFFTSRATRASNKSKSIDAFDRRSIILRRHRALFTFGENVGTDTVPRAVAQIEMAADSPAGRDRSLENEPGAAATAVFTSIANWSTSGLKDIDWRGEKYLWSKSREFLRFVAAPKRSGEPFRACDGHQGCAKTREKFVRNGWRFRGPHEYERRLLAVSRLHPAFERRVHRRERSICPAATPAGSATAAPAISQRDGRSSLKKPGSPSTTETTAAYSPLIR